MSVRKLTTSLLTSLAIFSGVQFAGGQFAFAQNNNYLTPGDPFHMQTDTAWFEPVYEADILDMKPEKRANTGWYGTIDKLHLYGTRPNIDESIPDTRSNSKFDSGGGTRYEFGYMLPDEDNGFLFSTFNLSIDAGDQQRILRINSLNDSQFPDGEIEFAAPRFGQDALVDFTGNNPGFNQRFYDVGPTLNVADLNSYELMKTFRMEPYHYGGILEPMIGVRYLRFDDVNGTSRYQRGFEPIDGFNSTSFFTGENFSSLLGVEDAVETYDTFVNRTRNDIFTGQVGARYFKYSGRVRYSAEARLFTGMSFQSSTFQQTREVTVYDGFDVADEVTANIRSGTNQRIFDNNEFFIGFDLRSEIGIQLTKMIQVRGGVQLVDLSKGVWRGGTEQGFVSGGSTDQDFVAAGFTFGIELNR